MRTRKRRGQKSQIKLVVGMTLCLTLFLSVAYSAFSTQISLNAKGNINKKISATDTLIAKAVTSGDGLYADSTEDGRYVFRGANPDNYITFNNETWRIISVETDGTLKIIKNDSIGSYIYDSTDNDWATSSLNKYLNETYYSSLSNTSNIASHNWNIGAVTYDTSYAQTLATDISQEATTKYTANIGLLNVSDYAKANTNITNCGTVSLNLYGAKNYSTCKTTNWLYNGKSYFTVNIVNSSNDGKSVRVWYISADGDLANDVENNCITSDDGGGIYNKFDTYPVLYLSSDITFVSGDGTSSQPYQIQSESDNSSTTTQSLSDVLSASMTSASKATLTYTGSTDITLSVSFYVNSSDTTDTSTATLLNTQSIQSTATSVEYDNSSAGYHFVIIKDSTNTYSGSVDSNNTYYYSGHTGGGSK